MSFPVNRQSNNQSTSNSIQINNNQAPIKKGDQVIQNLSFSRLNINAIDGLQDSSSTHFSPVEENPSNKYQSLSFVKKSDDDETKAFYASFASEIGDLQRRDSNSLCEKAQEALQSRQGKDYIAAAPLLLKASMLDFDNDEAASLLDAIQKDAEKDPNAAFALALTYKELNCYDQAMHFFDKAIVMGSEEAKGERENFEDEYKLKKLEEFLKNKIQQKEKEQLLPQSRVGLATLNEDDSEVDMDLTKIGVTPAANKKDSRKFSFTMPQTVTEGKEKEEDQVSEEQLVFNLQSPRGPKHIKQLSQSLTSKEEGESIADAAFSAARKLLVLGQNLEAAKLLKVAISLGSKRAEKVRLPETLSNK